MTKRTKLAIIIVVAILLLLIGVWFFIQPLLKARNVAQPPALPSQVGGYIPPGTTQTKQVPPPATIPAKPPTPEQNTQLVLENTARATVERVGSGASGSGFLGYRDALVDMTAAGQAAALAEQKTMQQEHPASGPAFGITIVPNGASHLTKGAIGDAQVQVTVDVLQNIDAGNPAAPVATKRKQVIVTFAKQADGSYLVDSLVWTEIAM